MKKSKTFWELGLNPIIMKKYNKTVNRNKVGDKLYKKRNAK